MAGEITFSDESKTEISMKSMFGCAGAKQMRLSVK